jgi:hypothetical protein
MDQCIDELRNGIDDIHLIHDSVELAKTIVKNLK